MAKFNRADQEAKVAKVNREDRVAKVNREDQVAKVNREEQAAKVTTMITTTTTWATDNMTDRIHRAETVSTTTILVDHLSRSTEGKSVTH